MHRITFQASEDLTAVGRAGDTILTSALRSGIAFPYECVSGGCGACKFELIDGAVSVLWPEAPGLSPRDRQKGNRHLACQCTPATDICIRVHLDDKYQPKFPIRKLAARVVEVELLTHDMVRLVLDADEALEFAPGQFCLLSDPSRPDVTRAYSIANLPNSNGRLEFFIKRKPGGRFSPGLFDPDIQKRLLNVQGPFGISEYRLGIDRDVICIGGGAGLSYTTAIACAAVAERKRHVTMFYGARTVRDLVSSSVLGLAEPDVTLIPVLSEPIGDTWQGEMGLVHSAVESALGDHLVKCELYVAGPPPMIDATVRMLLARGVPRDQIHFDAFL